VLGLSTISTKIHQETGGEIQTGIITGVSTNTVSIIRNLYKLITSKFNKLNFD
jgi:hypothetical protein